MASHWYLISLNGKANVGGRGENLTAAQAVAWVRRSYLPVGTQIKIERCRVVLGNSPPRSWLPYRSYVVDPDGIVRRTDRTPA